MPALQHRISLLACSVSARRALYSKRSTLLPLRPPPAAVARLRLLLATLPAGLSVIKEGSCSAQGQGVEERRRLQHGEHGEHAQH